MQDAEIQKLCERGQQELMRTDYLAAVDTFITAEQAAWNLKAFDTLSRLYLPLQEARRQVRQRCGEGAVRLRPSIASSQQGIDPLQLVSDCTHGQLLVAGWGSIAPAVSVRQLANDKQLYVETFLGAVYPARERESVAASGSTGVSPVPSDPRYRQDAVTVVVVPLKESKLPSTVEVQTVDQLRGKLPFGSLVLSTDELPLDIARGTAESYAIVMSLWERLHRPFLEAGDRETDPIKKMEAYRLTLRVDPACELAHQQLADAARELARGAS
jgi:hypothetical protein